MFLSVNRQNNEAEADIAMCVGPDFVVASYTNVLWNRFRYDIKKTRHKIFVDKRIFYTACTAAAAGATVAHRRR